MKGRLIALLCICIAILIVSGPDTQGKKPEKPGKPDQWTQIEWIAFEEEVLSVSEGILGTLSGGKAIKGCCQNAGPYPNYTMTLTLHSEFGDIVETYDGQLFISNWAKEYVVHFWWADVDADTGIGIEIIGGVIDYDRKNKVVRVTFDKAVCWMCEELELEEGVPTGVCGDEPYYRTIWGTYDHNWISFEGVSFTLVRSPCDCDLDDLDDCSLDDC